MNSRPENATFGEVASVDFSRIVTFLADPASYSWKPGSVRLVQTHISVVAIASPWAFKVKKAVDFGFLDFTTLEKRRHYCKEEVVLNRRLCDGIYEDVIPIYEDEAGRLNFSGGSVVEYAIRMHEIPPAAFLPAAISAGVPVPVDRIVKRLVSFYAAQSPVRLEDDVYLDRVARPMLENLPPTMHYSAAVIPFEVMDLLRLFFDLCLEIRRETLLRRMHGGCVANHHGDLHLDHIVLSPAGQDLCIFDCIEFNDAFRIIDRASDVAFLAMDLDHHILRPVTRKLEQSMCTELAAAIAGEEAASFLAVQDLFRAYRACVRGKVHSLTSESAGLSDEARQAETERARSYLQLALRYALAGTEPFCIVTVGRVGCGKSALARTLAAWLGVQQLSSDVLRKALFGLSTLEPTPDGQKAVVYGNEASTQTYDQLISRGVADALRDGVAVIDATFASAGRRDEARRRMGDAGVRMVLVEVTARDDVRRERLEWRRRRPNQSDARLEDMNALDARYAPPGPGEVVVRVDSSEGTREETAARAARWIMEWRLRST